MDWEGDNCSSTVGDWGVGWTVSTAGKKNSMRGSAGTSVTGGAEAGSAAKTGFSNMKVRILPGPGEIPKIVGCQWGQQEVPTLLLLLPNQRCFRNR